MCNCNNSFFSQLDLKILYFILRTKESDSNHISTYQVFIFIEICHPLKRSQVCPHPRPAISVFLCFPWQWAGLKPICLCIDTEQYEVSSLIQQILTLAIYLQSHRARKTRFYYLLRFSFSFCNFELKLIN